MVADPELGCLPVSAMVHVPKAQEVLNEDGTFTDSQDINSWTEYFGRTFAQLEWWAVAAQIHRLHSDMIQPKAFKQDPSQRNAP